MTTHTIVCSSSGYKPTGRAPAVVARTEEQRFITECTAMVKLKQTEKINRKEKTHLKKTALIEK